MLDYRLSALRVAEHAELYLESEIGVSEVLESGCSRVVIATGSAWTTAMYAGNELPALPLPQPGILTPDDIAAGIKPTGPVVLFDFDNYVMGAALAERLAADGVETIYVTPAGHASAWSFMTNELPLIHQALRRRGVTVQTLQTVKDFDGTEIILQHLFTGAETRLACRSLVVVGLRRPRDQLFHRLNADPAALEQAGIQQLVRIGDALAPGALAHAVHSGHAYGREFNASPGYRRDRPIVGDTLGML